MESNDQASNSNSCCRCEGTISKEGVKEIRVRKRKVLDLIYLNLFKIIGMMTYIYIMIRISTTGYLLKIVFYNSLQRPSRKRSE